MINYDELKQMAKDTPGTNIADLVALAPKNDPYYTGSPGQLAKGQWFADLWNRFGYSTGIHLRRVHYQLVSQDPPILKPSGEPYENTLNDWDYILEAGKAARYLGLVDPAAFVDRRNPTPTILRQYRYRSPADFSIPYWSDFEVTLPEWPDLPDYNINGYEENQPYHLEIWVEKTTMDDVLLPICHDCKVNLITGAGELSITAVRDFVRRVRRAERPAVIFYIADFDPAGYGMPVSVARKIEFFLQDLNLDCAVTLQPIALTLDQVQQYNLPRTPIKATELRKQRFEDTFGTGAVELDALEALYPGILAQTVQHAVSRYHDETLKDRNEEQYNKLRDALDWARAYVLIPYANKLANLQDAFDDAVNEFEAVIENITEQLPDLIAHIKDELGSVDVDIDDYPEPEPEDADEIETPLFHSTRTYFEQLDAYKIYRNGHQDPAQRLPPLH
jgi:hypothetical protein